MVRNCKDEASGVSSLHHRNAVHFIPYIHVMSTTGVIGTWIQSRKGNEVRGCSTNRKDEASGFSMLTITSQKVETQYNPK